MKKPNPQTEIRHLRRELKRSREAVKYASTQMARLQRTVEKQAAELTRADERFDALLGRKGEK